MPETTRETMHETPRRTMCATTHENHRGLTLIQFMLVLVVVGLVAFWVVEYLRGRLG